MSAFLGFDSPLGVDCLNCPRTNQGPQSAFCGCSFLMPYDHGAKLGSQHASATRTASDPNFADARVTDAAAFGNVSF